jgi:hypothetical protein
MTNSQREYLMASMRVASANLRAWHLAIDEIGLGMRHRVITDDDAIKQLDDLDLLRWLPNPQQHNQQRGAT